MSKKKKNASLGAPLLSVAPSTPGITAIVRGLRLTRFCIGLILCSGILSAQDNGQDEAPDFYADSQLLRGYVEQTLEQNPALQEAWSRYRAELQKIPQVTALPDPMLNFTQFVRSLETRVGPQLNSINLSQRFPWFGKLDLKGQVAFKEAAFRYYTFRSLQRSLIADVKRAYYELAYSDTALRIAREENSLLAHYEELAQSRYAAGEGLQQGVIKLQAELARVENRLYSLKQQRRLRVAQLNILMGRSSHLDFPAVDRLDLPPLPPLELQSLFEESEKHRYELQAVLVRIEKNEQSIQLARRDYWPDVTLSAGLVNVGDRDDTMGRLSPPPDNGKNAYNFSIGVNLPIWRDKYNAGVLEATENLIAERQNYVKVRDQIRLAVQDPVIRLQTLNDQIRLFESVLIPQMEESLKSTESAYQTGQVQVLDLLDSERALLDIRLSNLRFYADYLRALTDLEWALGTHFPR